MCLTRKLKKAFSGLLRIEDVGDIGTEYTFIPSKDDQPILTGSKPAKIELVKDETFLAEYKITVDITVPKSADDRAYEEKRLYICGGERSGGRSKETVTIQVDFYVSLARNGKRADIRCEFENTAKDHRLRVLFPTGLKCTTHKAESVFEAPLRDNKHKPTWTYPSGCEHQQGFVMMKDNKAGLSVANIGLYEYEILSDNTIAVTLVRSVSEMGDWGVFPTELSQVQKKLSLEFSIIPFEDEGEVYSEAAAFQCPMTVTRLKQSTDKSYKNNQLVWNGDCLRLTTFKKAQESDDVIMRWVNYSEKSQALTIKKSDWIKNLYLSDIIEKKGESVCAEEESFVIEVKPFEIITLGSYL